MGAAAAIGMGVSTALGIYANETTARANKKSNEYNAQLMEYKAVDALARGEEEAANVQTDYRGFAGEQRTAIAGQGVDLSSGTAQKLAAQTEHRAQVAINQVRVNAAREAFGYQAQAVGYRKAGRNAYTGAQLNTVGQALTGGVQTAAMTRQYLREG